MGHLCLSSNEISSMPFKSTIIVSRSLQFVSASQFQRMATCFKFLWGQQPTSVTTFCSTCLLLWEKSTAKLSGLKQQFLMTSCETIKEKLRSFDLRIQWLMIENLKINWLYKNGSICRLSILFHQSLYLFLCQYYILS